MVHSQVSAALDTNEAVRRRIDVGDAALVTLQTFLIVLEGRQLA